MSGLAQFAATLAALAEREAGDPITWLWDHLQHQGTLKLAAYQYMPELVELDGEPELWRLLGVLAGNARSPVGTGRPTVASEDRFNAALARIQTRVRAELPTAAPDAARAMMTAFVGAIQDRPLYDAMSRLELDCELERWCDCCGAYMLSESPADVVFGWRGAQIAIDLPAPDATRGLSVLETARTAADPAIAGWVGKLLGSWDCPRCKRRHAVVGDDARMPGETIRRRAPGASGEIIVTDDEAVAAVVDALLDTVTEDRVQLPGLGSLRRRFYAPYPPTPDAPRKARADFDESGLVRAMIDTGEMSAPIASNDPRLDRLAAAILDGVAMHDRVIVTGLATFAIERRDHIAFHHDAALDDALNTPDALLVS